MFDPTRIDYAAAAKVARDGSPMLLQALGRLYGIGPVERRAFGATGEGVPTWAWVIVAGAAGLILGTRLQKHYPQYIPNILSGESK